jgi:Mlc titration factor MtfA (ptsG expression regulator)
MGSVLFFAALIVGIKILDYLDNRTKKHRAYTEACGAPPVEETDLYFHGRTIDITNAHLERTLNKRFPYYRSLEEKQKARFLRRLKKFIRKKTFIIKDEEGFKEMPVLVSAAAIQLSFGLKHYLLPFYRYIRIFPEEYIAADSFKILAGNVQNNVISVAWNHLLQGYENQSDGSNLGLHEMSHALYIQKMVIDEHYAPEFTSRYQDLVSECHEAYKMELEGRKDLYSPYADSNLQEFWAESVEIFFEKPDALNDHYPDVFAAISMLLNQDPRKKEDPVLISRLSFGEKWEMIRKVPSLKKIIGKQL